MYKPPSLPAHGDTRCHAWNIADVVGVDTSIILPSAVWVASGHVSVFNDPLIECLTCHKRHRADVPP